MISEKNENKLIKILSYILVGLLVFDIFVSITSMLLAIIENENVIATTVVNSTFTIIDILGVIFILKKKAISIFNVDGFFNIFSFNTSSKYFTA